MRAHTHIYICAHTHIYIYIYSPVQQPNAVGMMFVVRSLFHKYQGLAVLTTSAMWLVVSAFFVYVLERCVCGEGVWGV